MRVIAVDIAKAVVSVVDKNLRGVGITKPEICLFWMYKLRNRIEYEILITSCLKIQLKQPVDSRR